MLFDWQAKHSTSTLLSSPAIIYTDGACSGNPGPGGYGAVILRNGKRKEISRGFNHTTNNRMEIMAIIHALKELGENPCDVELYSDSKYVVDAVNKSWVTTWKANNWIRANKKTALNIDLWERLLPLLEIHNIKLTWVKGHSTNIENKRSDYLAKEAVKNPNKEDDVYIIA
ncbi:MAG: ribonuclease HI [Defluviitaleaceae bacterium]|nr:ribonuclease HI [Defluviitaleaceae bacterium]